MNRTADFLAVLIQRFDGISIKACRRLHFFPKVYL